jgi:ubiquinone biosynthesis UbiH/UbiF/VisC/COQ6 family hydroxylase
MRLQSEVCIVGNGAVGKTLALGLAQAGVSVVLLGGGESKAAQQAAPAWDVRVYALNHVAHDLLSSLKVWEAMDGERIAPVEAMCVYGDAAATGGKIEFDAYGARVSALAWIVEDGNLNRALDAALKFAPNVRTVDGRAIKLAADSSAGAIELSDGTVLQAPLLVGADGANSWVRAQCDIGMDYRSYHQRAVVANFDSEKPHHGVAYQWFAGAEGIVALLPLPGNKVSLVWSAPDGLAEQLLSEPASRLAERLGKFSNDHLGRLTTMQPETVKAFPLSLIRPHAITAHRVALVGDAAHVVHPLAGHGMNLGFADVAALLKILKEREAHRDCGDARVLSRYARARKEDILLMQAATDGLQRLFAAEFEPLRALRSFGLNLVNHLPAIKRRLITQALGK